MMNRLQRKFLLVSSAVHALLLVVLLVGPAFAPKRSAPPKDLPILHVIPSHLIDAPLYREGGGEPAQPTATPAQPPAQSKPVVEQPKAQPTPTPRPAPPTPTVTQPKVTPPAEPKPQVKAVEPKPAPKPQIKVQRELVTRRADPGQQSREREVAERERQDVAQALQDSVRRTVRGIEENVSGKTEVEISGPGGAAYANYRQAVQTAYDRAWIAPAEVQDSRASVQVEVTIHRSGKVIRDRIVKRSGISSLDRSVEEALYRVRAAGLRPFPQEAQDRGDMERVFRINFNLSSRLQLG